MQHVTLAHLHEVPNPQLAQLTAVMDEEYTAHLAASPRVAALFGALVNGLACEVRRREEAGLAHSAAPIIIELPTAGELSDAEMRGVMRTMLAGRTAVAGGTPAVGRVFTAIIRALHGTRREQRATLARMHQALADLR
jgi:hypothetical protein